MKKAIIILTVLTLTIGGCARPMNNRPERDQRNHRKPAPRMEQPGPDRRPNSY